MLYTERSRIPKGLTIESERVRELERDKDRKRETEKESNLDI